MEKEKVCKLRRNILDKLCLFDEIYNKNINLDTVKSNNIKKTSKKK